MTRRETMIPKERAEAAAITDPSAEWRLDTGAATLRGVRYHVGRKGRMTTETDSAPTQFTMLDSLRLRRDRAERILNGLRAGVLCLLIAAALAYAPSLSADLNRTNVIVLTPALAWTIAQYLLWYKRRTLPDWLSVANSTIDVTAV